MKKIMMAGLGLCSLMQVLAVGAPTRSPGDLLDSFNVVWDSPSKNSHGSMPLGNGDVGINAWVEPSGDLVFYVSKTDAWDENGRLCKVGRIRVKFDPALSVESGFRQELKLKDGLIQIGGRFQNPESRIGKEETGIRDPEASIRIWVDANQPVVRVEAEAQVPVHCRAEVELWRLKERPFGADDSHSGNGLGGTSFKPTVLPDVVVPSEPARVAWYHRNTRSIFDLTLEVQNLSVLKGRFADPLLNHAFGASLSGEGLVRAGERAVRSAKPGKRHQLAVCVLSGRMETPEAWLKDLGTLERSVPRAAKSRRVTAKWWQSFWNRSWVFTDGSKDQSVLTRGYVLQRFLNACNGRGASPIKFNGAIFNVENVPGASPESPEGDPDWRRWGGNYWFQNTRHQYWPMPECGDFDMMKPFFGMYLKALPLGKARMKTYYNFENAAIFPETMYFWGLPNNGDYGWGNKAPEPANSYIRRYWSGNLELVAMMLDYYDFTQDGRFARDTLVPLADPMISFLDQYWQKRDANGKRVFEPAQSLETYHQASNPLPEIVGLRMILPRLLAMPGEITTAGQRARWTAFLAELPAVPMAGAKGEEVFRPGDTFASKANAENPELYGVFPFRTCGVGRDLLDVGRRTFARRIHHLNACWCQDSIQAACLGLADEASTLVVKRASAGTADYRFPAIWAANNDWIPDMDHGSPILTTVNYMLLQPVGDKILLFPAWPKDWNVTFRLHAPKNTTVEGELRDGKVVSLKVKPGSRAADVVNMLAK